MIAACRWELSMETDMLQRRHWRKSNQWFLLTRKHAQVTAQLLCCHAFDASAEVPRLGRHQRWQDVLSSVPQRKSTSS